MIATIIRYGAKWDGGQSQWYDTADEARRHYGHRSGFHIVCKHISPSDFELFCAERGLKPYSRHAVDLFKSVTGHYANHQ